MLSIIIPAYNEEKRLSKRLDNIRSYLKNENIKKSEIIIVIDKGKDKTLDVIKYYAKKYDNIKYLCNTNRRGKGYAIRKGVLLSKGKLVLFTDADMSTPITELNKFLMKIRDYSIVIGSRAHKQSVVKKKLLSRAIIGNLGNILLRLFLIKNIKDTQCGFKLFRGEVARKLFSLSRINGFGFDFEIIFLAQKFGYKINECPITWTHDNDTKVTWQSHFVTLMELFAIIKNNFLGYYNKNRY